MNRALHILGWILSVAALLWGIGTIISERRYPNYGNSLIFAGAFIVVGFAVNPLILRSVRLFGRPSFTVAAGIIIALAMVGYSSWVATS